MSPPPLVLAASALLLLAACGAPSQAPSDSLAHQDSGSHKAGAPPGSSGLSATIRRTSHGVPHIVAGDYASLGYGYGYAFAQDNLCTLAEELVTVNAQRSRYFGPEAIYHYQVLGMFMPNLKSDFYYQSIKDAGTVERLLALQPPHGPSAQMRALVRGYAAGYNRYLSDTGVNALPDPRCRGAAWVRPITELDLYRRYYQLSLMASSGFFIAAMVDAQPPSPSLDTVLPAAAGPLKFDLSQLPTPENLQLGSNGYGLGREATSNGRGMVLGNPHFPWEGPERFYQAHLTIPGELNVSGVSLFGVPMILIGYNDTMAWTHTVSVGYRFTPFELKLVPGKPTTYLYEGQPREMTTQTVTVMARRADGTLEPRSHTFYRTHFGPMINYPQANFLWTPTTAYAIRDANQNNLRVLEQFLAMNKARTVEQLRTALDTYQGIPWVNTLAADSQGNAFYADAAVVPHVTNEQISRCVVTPVGRAVYQLARLPVLDGSRAECEWGSDPDAVEPGIFGPGNQPHLFRADYVVNSNDSYWLTNPEQPLTGYPRIIGDEGTARSLRTRLALHMVQQRLAGTDGLPGQRFTLQQLQTIAFNNRNHSGELMRDAVVEMCRRTPLIPVVIPTRSTAQLVDVSEACPILAAWDLRGDLDSPGAVLWREFIRLATAATGGPYLVPFDVNDPVNTPHTLNQAHPQVIQALGTAVHQLRTDGFPLNASLRDRQFTPRGDEAIPIHGCYHNEGCFNALVAARRADNKKWELVGGSSFVMAVSFTDSGPVARTIVTYSQSTNPASPYFEDQTRMYSNKQWVSLPFTEYEISSDPNLTLTLLHN